MMSLSVDEIAFAHRLATEMVEDAFQQPYTKAIHEHETKIRKLFYYPVPAPPKTLEQRAAHVLWKIEFGLKLLDIREESRKR